MTADPSEKEAFTKTEDAGLYLACSFLLLAILYLDWKLPLGVAIAVLYNTVVLVALQSNRKKFILAVAIVASLFTICPIFQKTPIDEMWKAVCNRSLALFSIWVACYLGLQKKNLEEKRANTLRERERAWEEVRVLRGFLPICASCKRIRDYEGSWTLIEKYISEHSEAEFSHGLCPECTRTLFPDYFPDKARTED